MVDLPPSQGQAALGWGCRRRAEDGLTVGDQAGPPPRLLAGNTAPACQEVTEGTVKHGLALVGVVEAENSEVLRSDLQWGTLDSLAPGVSP